MVSVLRNPVEPHEAVSKVLHQASCLHCSLRGRASMHWEQAARWIVRACGAYRPDEYVDEEEDEGDPGMGSEECDIATWDVDPPSECEVCCTTQFGREIVVSNTLDAQLSGPAQRDTGRRLPATQ